VKFASQPVDLCRMPWREGHGNGENYDPREVHWLLTATKDRSGYLSKV
jgi:hypothetical protein